MSFADRKDGDILDIYDVISIAFVSFVCGMIVGIMIMAIAVASGEGRKETD